MNRNHELDGLRGYAAIAVLIFHTIVRLDPNLIGTVLYHRLPMPDAYGWFAKIVLSIFNGETAVYFFFVLSGTVLLKSLMRENSSFVGVARTFAVRRFFRIYPALLVCLLVRFLMSHFSAEPYSLQDLAINASLYDFPINGATWTLNVEMVAIGGLLLLFLGYWLIAEWGMIGAAIVIGLILHIMAPGPRAFHFWGYFLLGAFIPTRIGKWIAERTPTSAWPIILLFVIFFRSTVQQVAIALLVMTLYYQKSGSLGRALELPVSQFFGRISYSFYLYNVFLFEAASDYLRQFPVVSGQPIALGLLTSIAVLICSIPLAYISMRYVETPGIKLGKRFTTLLTRARPGIAKTSANFDITA